MTTVTMAPAAEGGAHEGTQRRPTQHRSRRAVLLSGRSPELLAGDMQPGVTGVRPAVRRVRSADGAAPPRLRSRRPSVTADRPLPMPCDHSYERDLHGSRLTRRGKFVVGAIWLVFAAAIVFMVSRPAEVPMPPETAMVTVKSGDTLWAVAGDVAPGVDPRVTVEQIMVLNGLLSAGDIHPGDLLVVPVLAD